MLGIPGHGVVWGWLFDNEAPIATPPGGVDLGLHDFDPALPHRAPIFLLQGCAPGRVLHAGGEARAQQGAQQRL